jgi:non-ribosomal peptide synthetase component E (peptide arylation enzyme)
MLLVNHLKKFADRTHDKKLLIFRNSEFTFKEFDEITDRIAASFLRAGVKRGTASFSF